VAGRLPLKLSDGRLQAAGARPAQPTRRGGGAEDEAGAALNDDGRGRREDDEEEAEEAEEGGSGGEEEEEEEEEAEAARRAAAAHARRDVTSFRELRALPPSKAAARRSEKKVAVAELSQRIIADPEHSVSASSSRALASAASRAGTASGDEDKLKRNHMLALHGLCADADPAIRRLAMLSLTTVFKDILPGYRIRLPTAAEAATKAKKDVARLRDYEACLLTSYQRFLRLLEHTVSMGEGARRGMLLRAQKRGGRSEEEEEAGDKSGAGSFEVDNGAEKDVWADEDEEEGGKGKGKKGGVGTRDFVAAKMEAKKVAKAARDGMAPYDGDDESKIALGRAALSCLGALLSGMPHFNFRSNIAAFLVPRMSSKDEEAADIACGAAAAAFANDRSFECALEITRVLSDEAKTSTSRHGKPRLREKALQVLLKLPLGDLEKLDALDRDAKVNQYELKRAAKAARKARQQGKPQEGRLKVGSAGEVADEDADAMADIVAGLRAADAENSTERKKYAQAVLKRVITIYFRILRAPSHGGLLPVAMAGLARFAHLIDVSVVGDLLAALRDTLSSCGVAGPAEGEEGAGGREPTLSLSSALSTILTALRIMAGPGGVLNADEGTFAKFLFSSLLRVAGPGGAEHATVALYSLQALLINRREYSPDRVTAFVKRVLTLCLALPVPITLALLSTVRTILHRYSHVRSMMAAGGGGAGGAAGGVGAVRTDTTLGIASGEPGACHNPDRTGAALSTMGWELALLVNHWHPAVRTAAAACAGCLPVAPFEAPTALLQAHDEDSGLFVPPVSLPPTRGAFKYPREAARGEEDARTAGGSVPEPVRSALRALAGGKTRRLREKADLVLARSIAAAASLSAGRGGGKANGKGAKRSRTTS
jgi:hypothetical protein